jgi:YggT family protein
MNTPTDLTSPATASTATALTETAFTATDIASWILGPFFALITVLFIFRIVLTWYPQVELKPPFNLVTLLTEPFLAPTRKIISPIGGVDISPIIWVGICSLIREILLGQQGILTMMNRF